MELTGSTADRWEQMSNKINEIAMSVSAKQELVKGISSTIEELGAELDADRKVLEKLSNLALKEVLREESGTLNDEPPVVPESVPVDSTPQKQIREDIETPAKKSSKKSNKTQNQSETLPLLENVDSPEVDQSKQQES